MIKHFIEFVRSVIVNELVGVSLRLKEISAVAEGGVEVIGVGRVIVVVGKLGGGVEVGKVVVFIFCHIDIELIEAKVK